MGYKLRLVHTIMERILKVWDELRWLIICFHEWAVVCALLHDIGEDIACPSGTLIFKLFCNCIRFWGHGEIVASLLRPYISRKNFWILNNHEVFQGYYYLHHFDLVTAIWFYFILINNFLSGPREAENLERPRIFWRLCKVLRIIWCAFFWS